MDESRRDLIRMRLGDVTVPVGNVQGIVVHTTGDSNERQRYQGYLPHEIFQREMEMRENGWAREFADQMMRDFMRDERVPEEQRRRVSDTLRPRGQSRVRGRMAQHMYVMDEGRNNRGFIQSSSLTVRVSGQETIRSLNVHESLERARECLRGMNMNGIARSNLCVMEFSIERKSGEPMTSINMQLAETSAEIDGYISFANSMELGEGLSFFYMDKNYQNLYFISEKTGVAYLDLEGNGKIMEQSAFMGLEKAIFFEYWNDEPMGNEVIVKPGEHKGMKIMNHIGMKIILMRDKTMANFKQFPQKRL